MNAILSEVKGFTPVIDVIVKDVGLIEAVVYGVVWRYCRMADGVCSASMDKIGRRAGVSGRTALRHIKALCDKGYLIDTTPGVRNRPHVYKDSGKVKIKGLLEAGMAESHTSDAGMTESHSWYDRESDQGMTESTLKIPTKTHIKKETDICLGEFLMHWQSLFPSKPQPRENNASFKKKLALRLEDGEFKERWLYALERASKSKFCNDSGWFTAQWFVKNEENWLKCADGNYDNPGGENAGGPVRIKV